MWVGTIKRRNGFLEVIKTFNAHSRRVIVMKIVEKSVLTIYFFGKERPILMPLIGRREENETAPIPSPLFKIILTNRGQTHSDRMPSIKDIERQINTTIDFCSSWIFAPAPSAAGDIESRIVRQS